MEGDKDKGMLRVKDLRKAFVMAEGRVEAVKDVSFEIPDGRLLTLLGPSGCGKTTTLRCVAGLETPDHGEIYIGEQPVFLGSRGVVVPVYKRGIGMVFQSYAIWPHMTVFENVAFPFVHGGFKIPKPQVKEKVRQALELVGLAKLENRPAPLLSGGQQQRVALARALTYEPRLLLLDEPLSNLDAKLREEMRLELRELVDRLKITTLYVTHDQEEALVLSDHVAVMSDGQILQQGNPREIYLNPQDSFVASFIGNANFVEGKVERGGEKPGTAVLDTPLGKLVGPLPSGITSADRVSVVFRPEDILVHTGSSIQRPNVFAGTVERLIFVGSRVQCQIRVGSVLVHCEVGSHIDLQARREVSVEIPPDRIRVLRVRS